MLQEYSFFSRGKLVHLFDDVNRDRVKTESVKPPLCGTSEQVVDRHLIQIRKLRYRQRPFKTWQKCDRHRLLYRAVFPEK